MLKKDLQESIQFRGFYHVPGMETVLISKNGKVVSLDGMYCPIEQDDVSYRTYPFVKILGIGLFSIHRLLAITFLKCPGKPEDYMVNHIDGVKSNNAIENLEWCTAQENAIHAYETGLRPDNRPVLVKDLRDDSITRCYSLNRAAGFLNVNPGKLWKYLNSDDIAPFLDIYTAIYEGHDWKPLTKADIGNYRKGGIREVIQVMANRKDITIFESISTAAEYLKCSRASIIFRISGKRGVKGNGYSLYYGDQYEGNLNHAVRVKNNGPGHKDRVIPPRKPIPVYVTDTISKVTEWWPSVEAFAKAIGSVKNTIQKSMLIKEGWWKHYQIQYCKS